jgi:hypothetical protein
MRKEPGKKEIKDMQDDTQRGKEGGRYEGRGGQLPNS